MVKLVTDSVADLPQEVIDELGITVVPLEVSFGRNTYRDRVDITPAEFYSRLADASIMPYTSAPSPGVFADVFDSIAAHSDEIVAVFVPRRFSATQEAALAGIRLMKRKCTVEVIDSTFAIMGQGLLVIEAARRALAGAGMQEIVRMLSDNVPKVHVRVTLDTLEYLRRGGRIGKIQAFLGSMLKMNPIVGLKDGEAFPFTRVRTRSRAVEWLYNFACGFSKVRALAIEYGSDSTEAYKLADRFKTVFPGIPLYISNVSPVVGTHTGPGVLAVTVMEE